MTPHFKNHQAHVYHMVNAAIAAADPAQAVASKLTREGRTLVIDSTNNVHVKGRLRLLSVGKAAQPMAHAAMRIAGNLLECGIVISKQPQNEALAANIQFFQGSHPIPEAHNAIAGHAAMGLLDDLSADDVVLVLISGGASALLTQPILPFEDWQALNAGLLASGCTINEFNAVRKALDRCKGGGVAQAAQPARVIALILSDVLGNPLDVIGSGPTAPSSTTLSHALNILERTGVLTQLSADAQHIIQTLSERASSDVSFPADRVSNYIVGDIERAARAAAGAAAELGFAVSVGPLTLEGEASDIGQALIAKSEVQLPSSCRIVGGETTVTFANSQLSGLGGRNQEMALASLLALKNRPNVVFATFATDGEDGPTDAAGAIVTAEALAQAQRLGLSAEAYLTAHDSYHFFDQLDGSHIKTGSTGTNVNDLAFIIKYKPLP